MPILIIFGGLPGTGKTTIAQQLARELAGVYLRIDSMEQAIRDCGFVSKSLDDACDCSLCKVISRCLSYPGTTQAVDDVALSDHSAAQPIERLPRDVFHSSRCQAPGRLYVPSVNKRNTGLSAVGLCRVVLATVTVDEVRNRSQSFRLAAKPRLQRPRRRADRGLLGIG